MIGIGEMIIARFESSIGLNKEIYMSWFCIHEKVDAGTLYDPPEVWCELDCDYFCDENCPYRYSENDCQCDWADSQYDK